MSDNRNEEGILHRSSCKLPDSLQQDHQAHSCYCYLHTVLVAWRWLEVDWLQLEAARERDRVNLSAISNQFSKNLTAEILFNLNKFSA